MNSDQEINFEEVDLSNFEIFDDDPFNMSQDAESVVILPEKFKENRVEKMNKKGLLKYPRTRNGDTVYKMMFDNMSYENKNDYIFSLCKFINMNKVDVMFKYSPDGRSYIEKILSVLEIDSTKYITSKDIEMFSDALNRSVALCKTFDTANVHNKIIDDMQNKLKGLKNSSIGSEYNRIDKKISLEMASIDDFNCSKITFGYCKDTNNKIWSMNTLIESTFMTDIKEIDKFTLSNNYIYNLILSGIYLQVIKSEEKKDAINYYNILFETLRKNILSNVTLINNIRETMQKIPKEIFYNVDMYSRFIDATYSLAYIIATYSYPTYRIQEMFENFKNIINVIGGIFPKYADTEVINGWYKVSRLLLSTIKAYETNFLKSFYTTSEIMADNSLVSLNDPILQKISERHKLVDEIIELMYLNIFNVFTWRMKFVCKNLTIKTYEPAMEIQFSKNKYFDESEYKSIDDFEGRIRNIIKCK